MPPDTSPDPTTPLTTGSSPTRSSPPCQDCQAAPGRPGCLRVANEDEDGLVAATLAEFSAADPLLRGLALRLATLATQARGMPGVSATRALA
jgi:hypothetical protein